MGQAWHALYKRPRRATQFQLLLPAGFLVPQHQAAFICMSSELHQALVVHQVNATPVT